MFYMTSQDYDVVVVGSGGAGMVAALAAAHKGLSTVVIEKAAHYGGSTARSGGGVWIPNNQILKRARVSDTTEAARTYLHGIIGDSSVSGSNRSASTPISSVGPRCCPLCSSTRH
ncbi:FAD binding domain protein [Mycobacterium ulcerans str. Harvey]|uniref:FAD binding domain protein n=1 Tax=Mycobacterium ulcerans str. Harvey TaxID=1299332 RepID=A0ABN0QQP2_MYCUL|nr:FAD binding domain protein [Mycobacterium ulcerans str. Harvey]